MFERSAVRTVAIDGAEQLVQQVAVAVLDVDEVEARFGSQHGGVGVRRDELVEVAVRQHDGRVDGDTLIEHGVVECELRLRRAGRTRPAAGMRQLQTDDEIIGIAVHADVRVHQIGTQRSQVADRRGMEHELPGVGAAVGSHRDRFATPHELGAAVTEASPAAVHQVGRPPIGFAVPALHGQDREPVARPERAGGHVGKGERRGQRPARIDIIVHTELVGDAEMRQSRAELVHRAEALDLDDGVGAHSSSSSRCAMSASTARSFSSRRKTPGGVASDPIRPRSWRNSAASWR